MYASMLPQKQEKDHVADLPGAHFSAGIEYQSVQRAVLTVIRYEDKHT
jgi:hypothetical protein